MIRGFATIIAKKILYLATMMWLISIITFLVIHMAPNSFFASGALNPNMTTEAVEHLKTVYGLDRPLPVQYWMWLKSMSLLDFGVSFASGNSVISEIASHIGVTLTMNVVALCLVFVLSLHFGVRSALKGGLSEKGFKQISLVSYAMPSFYLALLLIYTMAMKLDLFPIGGLESLDKKEGVYRYLDMAWHMVLPVSVMVFAGFGSMLLYVRSLTKEILKSDYIFFARARGIRDDGLIKHYIYPNLRPFVVTVLGLSLPGLLGGSVILEQIFSIEGMGLLFYQSAMSRDYPVVMGILVTGAFLTLLGNMISDMVLYAIDPHRRRT